LQKSFLSHENICSHLLSPGTNSKLPHNAKTISWKIRKLSKPLPRISNEKREVLQYLKSVTGDEANKAWESPSL
jgi:hypothetical protein